MGTVTDIRHSSQDVILDIESELAFWRSHYPDSTFHRHGQPFEACVATLKFGYDLYLLNYRRPLGSLLPTLRDRYARDLSQAARLEWPLAEAAIRETWKRMRPGQGRRGTATASSTAAFAARG